MAHAGCAPDELPVVARGRYVEIATDRDEPICGGTADYFDRYIEAAFATIAETPPDHPFVRIEWLREPRVQGSIIGEGRARWVGDQVLVTTDRFLVHEHELAHAVHMWAWPNTNGFLKEGFAVLLDAKRIFDIVPWQTEHPSELDELIAGPFEETQYTLAFYLVSQIVADHGFEGLKEFWHAVPEGSSAAEVRAAYEEVFGEPIDVLVEPQTVDVPGLGPVEVTRWTCDFTLCVAPPDGPPLVEGPWTASGPMGCEDDPSAVGPSGGPSAGHPDLTGTGLYGNIWRTHTLVIGDRPYGDNRLATTPDVSTFFSVCSPYELTCDGRPHRWDGDGPYDVIETAPTYFDANRTYRVEVRAKSSDLPTDTPGSFTLEPARAERDR